MATKQQKAAILKRNSRKPTPADEARVKRAFEQLDTKAVNRQAWEMFERSDRLRNIAAKLKAERERQGLSLRDLCSRMDTSSGNLSKLETGHVTAPRIDTLERWAKALGVEVEIRLVRDGKQLDAA